MYNFKDSNTLANKLAFTLSLYLVKEPKSLANKLVFTLFLRLVKDDILANKLNYTIYAKLVASKKRLSKGSKSVSKDLRNYTSKSNQRR
jgi:hypothetical protein